MRPSHHAFGLLGPLLSIGFLVLLVIAGAALLWWLLKRRKPTGSDSVHHRPPWQSGPGPPPVPQPPASAVQILDERLARGDIDVDDYLTRRAALLGDRPPNGTEFQHERSGAPAGPPEDPS